MIKYRCLLQPELTFLPGSTTSLDRTSIGCSGNLNTCLPHKHQHFRDLNLGAGLAPNSTSCIRSSCNILANFMPTRKTTDEKSPRPNCPASCRAFHNTGCHL